MTITFFEQKKIWNKNTWISFYKILREGKSIDSLNNKEEDIATNLEHTTHIAKHQIALPKNLN